MSQPKRVPFDRIDASEPGCRECGRFAPPRFVHQLPYLLEYPEGLFCSAEHRRAWLKSHRHGDARFSAGMLFSPRGGRA